MFHSGCTVLSFIIKIDSLCVYFHTFLLCTLYLSLSIIWRLWRFLCFIPFIPFYILWIFLPLKVFSVSFRLFTYLQPHFYTPFHCSIASSAISTLHFFSASCLLFHFTCSSFIDHLVSRYACSTCFISLCLPDFFHFCVSFHCLHAKLFRAVYCSTSLRSAASMRVIDKHTVSQSVLGVFPLLGSKKFAFT